VNEVNAAGGRIVTSPTNGAAGVIPAVLKYTTEFVTDDAARAVETFLLTAAAVGMLFKRGSTISAAEGGCQAEVGVACSMAAAGFAACMGAPPETVLQAAEIGIEHNLGLTCDPVDGLVQVPCIERNSLGAVKALTAAQLAMASGGVYSVTLDEVRLRASSYRQEADGCAGDCGDAAHGRRDGACFFGKHPGRGADTSLQSTKFKETSMSVRVQTVDRLPS
jgi:iron-sulfur-dependent L-serine dehydratase single chain form